MKKKHHKKQHRNNGAQPRAPGPPRASPKKSRGRGGGMGLMEITAIVAGGAASAGLGVLAERASPTASTVATAAMAAASVAGAHLGDGAVQAASVGMLGAVAGHVVVALLPKKRNAATVDDAIDDPGYRERRQAALPPPEHEPSPSLREALARAHAAVAVAYPDDDYAAHSFAA